MKNVVSFLFVFLVGAFNFTYAQDTIFFKNNESKIVKITKIKSDELTSKDITNLEGPDYIYLLKEIKEIHFNNGFVQSYNSDENAENVAEVEQKKYKEAKPYVSTLPENLDLSKYIERSKYYKNQYYRREPSDPHNQWVAGIASYFVPGLGQMICGETGRGIAFLGGAAGASLVTIVGYAGLVGSVANSDLYDTGSYNTSGGVPIFAAMTVVGALATLGIEIWSIADAVNVAKVNNLYARDRRNHSQIKIQIAPYIENNKYAQITLGNKPQMGLSLRVNF